MGEWATKNLSLSFTNIWSKINNLISPNFCFINDAGVIIDETGMMIFFIFYDCIKVIFFRHIHKNLPKEKVDTSYIDLWWITTILSREVG